MPTVKPSSSGSRSASTTAWSGSRGACSNLLAERPTPERCVEAYYLQRTRFESIAERKLRRRQVDRGWGRGDQRKGFALGAGSRRPPTPRNRRSRPQNRHRHNRDRTAVSAPFRPFAVPVGSGTVGWRPCEKAIAANHGAIFCRCAGCSGAKTSNTLSQEQ